MLAQGEQPGQSRIPDAGVPVGLVHGDAERGRVPVGRVQREPVVELPVVTRRRDEQQAAGELTTVGIDVPGHDEQVEMALSPDLPAGQGETEPAQEGEDTRYDRLVQSRPQRWRAWPEGPIRSDRLRWPLAQIGQRAKAKPSQPRKARTPGTTGWFNLGHSDGVRGRRDLSSSDVEVSCNREPPPWLSQRGRAKSWPGGRSLPERRHTL